MPSSNFFVTRSALSRPAYSLFRSSRSALLSTLVSSPSVRPTREDVDHGKEVLCEFRLAGARFVVLVKKDETCPSSYDDPLDKVASESGKAVAVGHHNFCDQSFLDVLQKPREEA